MMELAIGIWGIAFSIFAVILKLFFRRGNWLMLPAAVLIFGCSCWLVHRALS